VVSSVLPKRILAPFDGREVSVPPLRFASRIAGLAGSPLQVVRIATEHHVARVAEQVTGGDRDEAFRFISRRAAASLEAIGLDPAPSSRTLIAKTVSRGILDLIREEEIQLVVLRAGGKPGSPRKDLAGSLRCIDNCDALFVNVHTARPWSGGGVVIAVDGHPASRATVSRGLKICAFFNRPALFVHVAESGGAPSAQASDCLSRAVAAAADEGVEAGMEVVFAARTESGIISVLIRFDADLVVVRRGRRTVWGSVADRVIRQSCYDVYVVNGGGDGA